MEKMSVLTLIHMKPNKLGALEEYSLHLSGELIRRGHHAAVGFSDYPPPWLMEKFESFGIQVLKFEPSDTGNKLIMDMRKAIQKHDLNIIHATFYPIYSKNLILATIGNGCKLIYSDQESRISHPTKGWRSLGRYLRNRVFQRYIEAIVADAEFIRECQIKDHFTKPEKLPIIYNGVNLKRFKRATTAERNNFLKEFNISQNSFLIVTIAQCIKEKGLNYLLDAAKMVADKHPNSIFFIVGDGPERSNLEKQASTLGIKDKVIFTGMRVDTEKFLSVADVFALLSVWEEAFAFSLLEAMASGCPIVATRIGAIPESVQDGVTGILVPPRDGESAANAILKLLNNDSLRLDMSMASRKRIEDLFSLEKWVSETIELYEKIVED